MADTVVIYRKSEAQVLARQPWVDGGMVKRRPGAAWPGGAVRLVSERGRFLAWGAWEGEGRFPIRLVSWDADAVVGPELFADLARESGLRRLRLPLADGTDAYRVIFAEADWLPGVIADRYGCYLVVISTGKALVPYLRPIAQAACEALGLQGAALREEDVSSRLWGSEVPGSLTIREGALRFRVDLSGGQKTGWFCDQRENRRIVAQHARGRRVLDVFCYTGGFTVAALAGGAESAVLVDSSGDALALAGENLRLAGLECRAELLREDGFEALRRLRDEGRRFDLVILDPPKFIPREADREAGSRAYIALQGLGMSLVEPGGLLVAFSCSGAMARGSFDRVVAAAAGKRPCRILQRLGQPPDHPISVAFPKGEYLTGLVLQLD